MKRTLYILIAVILFAALFAGCGNQSKPGQPTAGGKETEEPAALPEETDAPEITQDAPEVSELPAIANGTVAESYAAYLDAKGTVLTKLTDGISNNPDTSMAVFSFLGIAMVDLAALPVSFFGLGQEAVDAGVSFVGGTNVKYTENGSSYTIAYSDDENNKYVYSGTYDPGADALTCTATSNDAESFFLEYRKTAFGYAGQYYMLDDDGTALVYMVAVDGENGTIGISAASEKPAALTGSVSADFPKACSEWYSIFGATITGKTSDGANINFEYTPSESESN